MHRLLTEVLPPRARVLDGGCGTGVDAAWLREQGHEVVAVDAAAGMVEAARTRVPGLDARVLPLEAVHLLEGPPFDAAVIDFGVINVVDVERAAASLARVLAPGAPLVVVTMPRLAPSLVAGLLRRGRLAQAFGRLRSEVDVDVEGAAVRTRYLGPRALAAAFRPWFRLESSRGLGFLMPAPGSRADAERAARWSRREQPLRQLPGLRALGDHVAVLLRREALPPGQRRGPLRRRLLTAEAQRTGRIRRLRVLILELTQGCQSACTSCGFRGPAGGEALDLEAIRGLLQEARELGCEEVMLTGGEPLLRQDLPEICEAVVEAGFGLTLLTNGLALRRHAEVVARWCTRVVVSLDGHDGPSYARARGVDGFEAVRKGVLAVKERAPELPMTARVTVTGLNAGSLLPIAQAAQELGLDGVSYLAADLEGEDAFGDRAQPPPAPPDAASLRRELESLRAALPTGFLQDSEVALDRIWRLAQAREGGLPPGPPRCDAPWTSTVVGADLSLKPCFFLPPMGTAAEGLGVGLRAAAPTLRGLRVRDEDACARCVCWARLT